jgi:phage baseplate assembly protein W
MARELPRIIPVDVNKRQAIGVKLPFDSPSVFTSTFTTKEQVRSNLINLLLTYPGERILNPQFGVGLRNYLFEPDIDETLLTDIIRRQISIHVPYVILNQVRVENDVNRNVSYITIDYSLINSETDTLTFNFQ